MAEKAEAKEVKRRVMGGGTEGTGGQWRKVPLQLEAKVGRIDGGKKRAQGTDAVNYTTLPNTRTRQKKTGKTKQSVAWCARTTKLPSANTRSLDIVPSIRILGPNLIAIAHIMMFSLLSPCISLAEIPVQTRPLPPIHPSAYHTPSSSGSQNRVPIQHPRFPLFISIPPIYSYPVKLHPSLHSPLETSLDVHTVRPWSWVYPFDIHGST